MAGRLPLTSPAIPLACAVASSALASSPPVVIRHHSATYVLPWPRSFLTPFLESPLAGQERSQGVQPLPLLRPPEDGQAGQIQLVWGDSLYGRASLTYWPGMPLLLLSVLRSWRICSSLVLTFLNNFVPNVIFLIGSAPAVSELDHDFVRRGKGALQLTTKPHQPTDTFPSRQVLRSKLVHRIYAESFLFDQLFTITS